MFIKKDAMDVRDKNAPIILRRLGLQLLAGGIIAGIFLPFIHLATARHEHYFNLSSGEFYDIVPVFEGHHLDSSSGEVVPESAVRQGLDFGASVSNATSVQILFTYCLSANGILLNQLHSVEQRVSAAIRFFSEVNYHTDLLYATVGAVLRFAPKHSPPFNQQ
ncbi:MAG: hypothetical protein JXX29_04225 [Deltaproteobacteria bacterium]|nr:hypothetical protein [Deltaproteobacteria bacterium]MBN2670851.1 hypothetical protein [Deltaproteobacteria bacterium]